MIHDLGLIAGMTLSLLPYILVVAIIIATGWMVMKMIPIWIKRWRELDDWWK
jgi:flagellar biosynthesis protein FliQ